MPGSSGLDVLAASIQRFAERYAEEVERWRTDLRGFAENGAEVVIWGTGSKGVTFLNTVDVDRTISAAVDVNPRKHGKFVAGTGQTIIGPDDLPSVRPDLVIVMNPIYRDEIGRKLAELGLAPSVLTV